MKRLAVLLGLLVVLLSVSVFADGVLNCEGYVDDMVLSGDDDLVLDDERVTVGDGLSMTDCTILVGDFYTSVDNVDVEIDGSGQIKALFKEPIVGFLAGVGFTVEAGDVVIDFGDDYTVEMSEGASVYIDRANVVSDDDSMFFYDPEMEEFTLREGVELKVLEQMNVWVNGYAFDKLDVGDTLAYDGGELVLTMNKQELCSRDELREESVVWVYYNKPVEEDFDFLLYQDRCNTEFRFDAAEDEYSDESLKVRAGFDGVEVRVGIVDELDSFPELDNLKVYFNLNDGDSIELRKMENDEGPYYQAASRINKDSGTRKLYTVCGRTFNLGDATLGKGTLIGFELLDDKDYGSCEVESCSFSSNADSDGEKYSLSCVDPDVNVEVEKDELGSLDYDKGLWSASVGTKARLFFRNNVVLDEVSGFRELEKLGDGRYRLKANTFYWADFKVKPSSKTVYVYPEDSYFEVAGARIWDDLTDDHYTLKKLGDNQYKVFISDERLTKIDCCIGDGSGSYRGTFGGNAVYAPISYYGCDVSTGSLALNWLVGGAYSNLYLLSSAGQCSGDVVNLIVIEDDTEESVLGDTDLGEVEIDDVESSEDVTDLIVIEDEDSVVEEVTAEDVEQEVACIEVLDKSCPGDVIEGCETHSDCGIFMRWTCYNGECVNKFCVTDDNCYEKLGDQRPHSTGFVCGSDGFCDYVVWECEVDQDCGRYGNDGEIWECEQNECVLTYD